MSKGPRDTQSLDLFGGAAGADPEIRDLHWPAPGRFPLNVNRQKVRDQVLADLRASREPLIVAGYASLDQLIKRA